MRNGLSTTLIYQVDYYIHFITKKGYRLIYRNVLLAERKYIQFNIYYHNAHYCCYVHKFQQYNILEYYLSVWSSYTETAINPIEAVQRRAARWTKHNYGRTSSVTEMLPYISIGDN